ncbi:MAG: hypothetical protein HC929_18590 [Leptolyngbyaceae cyanobacterium SM2_5_2]|nr:hypothetical protein [Leptolyngbyaceae cyanobacterium SM2_5_2]
MAEVALVISGGFHPSSYTAQMLTIVAMDSLLSQIPVVTVDAAASVAPLSGQALRQALEQACSSDLALTETSRGWPELIIWAFSAGCVGTASLAHYWLRYRAPVRALFWVDGWGVPWDGSAPLHRLSHDYVTYRATRYLGSQGVGFLATPAVTHQRLWQSPQVVTGQQLGQTAARPTAGPPQLSQSLTAAEFLCGWSRYYLTPGP